VQLVGCDLPLHADPRRYREVVERMKHDRRVAGALVTTHKIDLYEACRDLFDSVDPYAELCGEASALAVRDGTLSAHATDPISSARAFDDFHRSRAPVHVLCLGGGGSATAITVQLLERRLAGRITVADVSADRLARIKAVHARLDPVANVGYIASEGTPTNDPLVGALPPGSIVINATGMGKDVPGSPLSDQAVFPEGGFAWDLNYRGDLGFLTQARKQQASRRLHVEDGWRYFIHGWAVVIGRVFDIDIDPDRTARLASIAQAERQSSR
jgi:shikimate 5-dehydrogenase